MNFLDDERILKQLSPFTLTRSIADIRIGILTIREKWEIAAGAGAQFTVPSHMLPTTEIIAALKAGKDHFDQGAIWLEYPWHIFQNNDRALRQDFEWITKGRISLEIPRSNTVITPENIFLEQGAKVEHSILNASTGPIYIGKNAQVMEGSVIRGPFALCEGGLVKLGTKVYGATTIGPFSMAGGEIKNSVIFGFSNKGHDGFLGDAVIGEWCNLGAGTSNSNIKNNAGEILMRDEATGLARSAGIKCGLLMGDYTRCAINTSFNTGTVAGVSCNIFGEGLAPRYIPHFSWGTQGGPRYVFEKAIRDIENWKRLKNRTISEEEIIRLKHIFDNY